jgi:hypothetical protein
MARPNPELIAAIEKTIVNLSKGAPYQWGHMGACNCGNLAQELTKLSKAEIHSYAMQRYGDWNEQILDFCPTSGYPMDLMIQKMMDFGLTLQDLSHLERLSDPEILSKIPKERRDKLSKNSKEDVVLYMENWAKLLRDNWLSQNPEISYPTEEKKLEVTVFS